MKKLITMAIMVLAVAAAMAQAPEKFTYQAVVRNASNALVANAPVGMRVSILQGSATGSAIYSETHVATTNANGLVTLSIGGGNSQQGAFADIDWANGPFFLKTEIDLNGGTNYSITSTQQLMSVPYALYAKEASNVPTNVGELTNDANYITLEDVPDIPSNVSAFTNDAGYLTNYTETDPTVPAWAKEANKPTYNYSEIVNTPELPTVPTNVSAFTNDAGYLTNYTETDPTVPAWAKEANKPTYNYSEIVNTPTIPTVPTNVSAFTNDAGYITGYTETDPTVPSWAKEADKPTYDYSEITNTPIIPTVPTNVSAFNNDAGYITIADIPTQVSAFENDALYITEGELQQTVNVINNTFDSVDNTIDSLRNRIEELEGNHTPPTVMTTGVADVAHTTVTLNGSVVYIGGAPVAAKGFCYDTVMHPTVGSATVSCGSGSGSFSANLLNLTSGTTYYVRAYATNLWGTNYGEELSFTTLVEYAPSVEILPASEISYTSFTCGGDVTDSGTYAVTARGFCWSTEPDPVMTGEHLHVGNGAGTFSATLADIQPETTYYVRAYAVNAVGVTYSTPITVTTLTPTIPTVTTDNVSTYNWCTGTVVDDGHAPVTQRGFVYDTLPNPTLSNGVVIAEGNGLGEFSELLTGLSIGKLYFVRAFATNARGTGYGDQLYFTAESDIQTVTDYDGNVYNTVTIGTQVWMKENLKTTHYSDGWPIELGLTTQSNNVAYYYYPGKNVSNVEMYGLLYNWAAVMRNSKSSNANPSGVQGICPTGWHVPSAAEWNQLRDYVNSHSIYACGGISDQTAKALADSIGWYINPNNNICTPSSDPSSNNATGFSARQAGSTSTVSVASNGGSGWDGAMFHCTTENNFNQSNIYYAGIDYTISSTFRWPVEGGTGSSYTNKRAGFSVRCLRD